MSNEHIDKIEKPIPKIWNRTFVFRSVKITVGFYNENQSPSLFAEILNKKGNLLYVNKYSFQQIKKGDKIRLAYHKQNKILEKQPDGQ